jgi:hypothetical protein
MQEDKGEVEKVKALELMANFTREMELEEEARAPSGDDHLLKVLNSPIKKAIQAIEVDNDRLKDRIENGDIFEDDGVTPQVARKLLQENVKSLVDMRNALAKTPTGATGASVEINLGTIFSDALHSAREATIDAQVVSGGSDESGVEAKST